MSQDLSLIHICVIPVFFCGQVQFHEVAWLDDSIAGDAVDYFVVYADADVAWEIVDRWRGGMGAVGGQDLGADFGELGGACLLYTSSRLAHPPGRN